jgi:peptidoglycan/xylan/chitin deacetylase (PgdA/CDA1 family)
MKAAAGGLIVLMFLAVFAGNACAAHQSTTWPDNKKGAVSLTFDDGSPSQISLGIPALDARGLKGSFFLITDAVKNGNSPTWSSWRNAATNGHEIGSHTISHPYLTTLSPAQVQEELAGSKTEIEAQITSQKCLTFVYPYGDFNSEVVSITRNIYIAARGVNCNLNSEPFDLFTVSACTPDDVNLDLYAQADAAEQQSKWLVVYYHSLDGGGPVDIDTFTTYLDYLKRKNLWVGTFGAMVKYIQERASATLSVISNASDRIVLSLTDALDDAIYSQPLTLRSGVPSGWTNVSVEQGGSITEVRSILEGTTRVIYYNAVPDRGLITLRDSQSPQITALAPQYVTAGSPGFALTVTGSNFTSGAKVRWNGSDRTTTFVSATQLRADILATDLATPGTIPVTVLNPDGGLSNAVTFEVRVLPPAVADLSPSVATAGSPAFTLTVYGSNFVSGAKVRWNGADRTTTFVSATQLQASITAANIATPGMIPVTVLNPDGGLSNAMTFTVWGPAPAVTGLSPSYATAGGSAFTLTVSGTSFVSGAKVRWNGADRTTTFVSATQLRASIPAADIASAGTIPVTVLNPDGGLSNSMTFEVRVPPPTVMSLSPAYVTAGAPAFTLAVSGTNFVSGAKVRWNGADRTTTFVSATQLQASIPAADVPSAGTIPVTVLNPDGGLSNTVNFTVNAPVPPPSVTGLSPSYVTAGAPAFTLTVSGTSFVSGAKVRWNGADRTTTFVSATQLRASIPAADIASAGTIPVTVLNPDGGLSNASNFEVRPPAAAYTDDFNRSNESPLKGNWTAWDFGLGSLELYNNQLRSTDANPYNVWARRTSEPYSSNHYSQIKLTSIPSREVGGPAVRVQLNGSTINGYIFTVGNSTTAAIWVRYGTSGTWQQVGTNFTGTFASGDVYKLAINGNVLTAYRNGVSLGTRTDGNNRVPSGGAPGVSVVNPGTWDDWQGGN